MPVVLSHGGETIFSSVSRSKQLLVGTTKGVVFMERDRSSTGWRIVHRALEDKHVHAIIVEPESSTIFVGATEDSVYASADGGQTWDRRGNGLAQNDIYCLASARVNGGVRVFAGTEPAHLFYSDDLGYNWAELTALRSVDMSRWVFPAPPHIAHTKHINFHPWDTNTLFISIEQGGLLKSTDAGETFHVNPGMDDDVHRTVINPENPDRIYITGGDGTYVTSNGGTSWEHWTTRESEIGGYPDFLVFHPRQPDLMFIAAAESNPGVWNETHFSGSRISRSRDGGKTWEILSNGLPDRLKGSVEAMALEDWGESFSLFIGTGTGEVWCSDDAGETWLEAMTGLAPVSKGDHYASLVTA